MGTRTVVLLNELRRDGTTQLLADAGIDLNSESAAALNADAAGRPYVVITGAGGASLSRYRNFDRERKPLPARFTSIAGLGFAGNGDPVVAGNEGAGVIAVVRLDASTLDPVAVRRLTA